MISISVGAPNAVFPETASSENASRVRNPRIASKHTSSEGGFQTMNQDGHHAAAGIAQGAPMRDLGFEGRTRAEKLRCIRNERSKRAGDLPERRNHRAIVVAAGDELDP